MVLLQTWKLYSSHRRETSAAKLLHIIQVTAPIERRAQIPKGAESGVDSIQLTVTHSNPLFKYHSLNQTVRDFLAFEHCQHCLYDSSPAYDLVLHGICTDMRRHNKVGIRQELVIRLDCGRLDFHRI